jgi:acyl-coenzyme A thioesterase PaaI-like protein
LRHLIRHTGQRFACRAQTKHVNARSVVHGGVVTSFADQVLGLTIEARAETRRLPLLASWSPVPTRVI